MAAPDEEWKDRSAYEIYTRYPITSLSKALFQPTMGQANLTAQVPINYEDFVEDPISDMERICAHCGLQMTNDMAKTVKEMVKSDRNLGWQRFDPHDLAGIIPEIHDEMQRHGYEIPAEIAQAIGTL